MYDSVRVLACQKISMTKGDFIQGTIVHVCTLVTLVPAKQGRKRLQLRHLNFDPYPSRTLAGPWVTSVATYETLRMS